MRLHCAFCDQPPCHWSEMHGYLCDGCWSYSDAALAKSKVPITFANLLGYCEPRFRPAKMTFAASLNHSEAVDILDAIPASDPESAHDEADALLLRLVAPEVSAAYKRLVDRCRWWATA